MSSPLSEMHQPDAQKSVVNSLHYLLGIAIIGALFTGIWFFGGFTENQQTGLLIKSSGFNYRLYGAMDLLAHEKFRGLIVLIFGAGLLWFVDKLNSKDRSSTADLLMRRQ